MGLKTPKPAQPQPRHVGLLCSVCHLIQTGAVGCDVMGQFSLTKPLVNMWNPCKFRRRWAINDYKWTLSPAANSDTVKEQLSVCVLLRVQGQKWLIKRSSFHKHWSDNLMWHTRVKNEGALKLPSSWTASTVISLQRFGPPEMSCYTLLKTHHYGLQKHPLQNQKHIQWVCKSAYSPHRARLTFPVNTSTTEHSPVF